MAESFKMTKDGKAGLQEAFVVYPDLPWKTDKFGQAHVFDAKRDEYVPVNKGDFIVSIGDRYEVTDKEPAKAKPAEEPKKTSEVKEPSSDDED